MPANSHPPTRGDFQKCLDAVLGIGRDNDLSSLVVQAGILHRIVGCYPGKNHRMPVCCGVMRNRMREGDEILPNALKKDGATLRIRYLLEK